MTDQNGSDPMLRNFHRDPPWPRHTYTMDLEDEFDCRYWQKKFAVTEQDLRDAIAAIGNNETRLVAEYINSNFVFEDAEQEPEQPIA
jgi:hypothetical protein